MRTTRSILVILGVAILMAASRPQWRLVVGRSSWR